MKFYLKWDAQYPSRATKNFGHFYPKMNYAIDAMRDMHGSSAFAIYFQASDGTSGTLMCQQRTEGYYSTSKLLGLLKVGTRTYVPKGIVRKTTRKRKKKCKK